MKAECVTLMVLDSVGIGAMPDAPKYGDEGANTLANVARAVGGLYIPNLSAMGLGCIWEIQGAEPVDKPISAYGKMAEKSPGKDTTTGHWEIAGIVLEKPFPLYPNGFPPEIITTLEESIGTKILGNIKASGTETIETLGKEHLKTGYPIVYTSADSVFQVAAHEEIIPPARLYRICEKARRILTGEHGVGRVIARPFVGEPGRFVRTGNRKDYSIQPPEGNMLDNIVEAGMEVIGVGKISDIFAGRGVTESIKTVDNMDGIDKTVEFMGKLGKGLIFTNLVDFDMHFGHRNDYLGYANALEEFDQRLPELTSILGKRDILVLTADHGCDPTTPGTDHSREFVPLLVYGPGVRAQNLGTRDSFADLAATICQLLDIAAPPHGTSFAQHLTKA
ncbi:MAG: phosphopentomutase [Clostridia bacterium]|nr:phosphopentomutase [Clostridia bacterium]